MPKMKTHKASAKRFKFTGTGKVKMAHCNKQHILTKKGQKRKRNLRKGNYADATNVAAIKLLLPYA